MKQMKRECIESIKNRTFMQLHPTRELAQFQQAIDESRRCHCRTDEYLS
jgi:hypothetical protein